MVNATIDDSSKIVNYTGFATGGNQNRTILPDDLVGRSRDNTLSYTATRYANATLSFTGAPMIIRSTMYRSHELGLVLGTAVEIVGPVGPTLSTYTLTVDGQNTLTYNASAPVFVAQQTLGFLTGLVQQEHTLFIRNEIEGMGLALDSFNVWGQGVACFG